MVIKFERKESIFGLKKLMYSGKGIVEKCCNYLKTKEIAGPVPLIHIAAGVDIDDFAGYIVVLKKV